MKIKRRELPETLPLWGLDEYLTKYGITVVIYSKIYEDNTEWLWATLEDDVGNEIKYLDGGEIWAIGTSEDVILNKLAEKISGYILSAAGVLNYSVPILKSR